MGRQDCAYSSHKPRAFLAPDIVPLEAMHRVFRLEKLSSGTGTSVLDFGILGHRCCNSHPLRPRAKTRRQAALDQSPPDAMEMTPFDIFYLA
jgi:hypothetical protein